MRMEDDPAPHSYKAYLHLACQEIARMCQGGRKSRPILLRGRKPHSLRDFADQMVALGMLEIAVAESVPAEADGAMNDETKAEYQGPIRAMRKKLRDIYPQSPEQLELGRNDIAAAEINLKELETAK